QPPQHPVGGRVLGADVQGHVLGVQLPVGLVAHDDADAGAVGGLEGRSAGLQIGGHAYSPGSLAPGQGLASLVSRANSLRRGWPSNSSGSSSLARLGWPSKPTPNSSAVSRSCQFAPAHRSLRVGRCPPSRGTTVRTWRWWRWLVEYTWSTTPMPSASSSTPHRKSKKLQARLGSRRASSATRRQSPGSTVTVRVP